MNPDAIAKTNCIALANAVADNLLNNNATTD